MMCIGIAANVLSFILFIRDSQTFVGTRFVLFCIAFTDIGYLSCMLSYCVPQLNHDNNNNKYVLSSLFISFKIFEIIRNWLLIAVTYERFLFFHEPVKFKLLWSLRRVRVIVSVIALSALACRLPDFMHIYAEAQDPPNCEIMRYAKICHTFIDLFALTLVPIIVMIVFSIKATKTVTHVMVKNLEGNKTGGAVEHAGEYSARIVTTLKVAMIIFVLTLLPSIPAAILEIYVELNPDADENIIFVQMILCTVANLVSVLNSTSNFFVHYCQSRHYRNIMTECLCSAQRQARRDAADTPVVERRIQIS